MVLRRQLQFSEAAKDDLGKVPMVYQMVHAMHAAYEIGAKSVVGLYL